MIGQFYKSKPVPINGKLGKWHDSKPKAVDNKVKADCIIGKYDYHFDLSNGVLHYKVTSEDTAEYAQHIAQDDYTVFATEEDFANYLADYLLNQNGQYANLDAILSYVEVQDTQWNIIEPIDANRQTELNGDSLK